MIRVAIRTAIAAWALAALPALAVEPALRLQPVASGLTQPVFVTHAPSDPSRLYIVEQRGKIKIIRNGQLLATPLIDITSLMGGSDAYTLEYGLLGLAFDPDFRTNGYFYLNYTSGTSNLADTIIARFQADLANPDSAPLASRVQILRVPYTQKNHRAGWIGFGPDRMLYVPTGDGGETDPQNNASNLASLSGKVLRLDVRGPDSTPGTPDDDDFPADANKNYHIPDDNPFLSNPNAAPEIWAYGLRNPWRCSFDRATGDFWIGDVGQSQREEIDRLPAGTSGAFLGWRCREGSLPTNYSGCPATLPPSILPVHEYGRDIGSAIIGGFMYRGCAIPELRGTYFLGDWTRKNFSFRYDGAATSAFLTRTGEIGVANTFVSYGEDYFGELYVCGWAQAAGAGTVSKIVPLLAPPDANANGIPDSCESCPADLDDGSGAGTPDQGVTVDDLVYFLAAFAGGDIRADLDDGSGTGTPDAGVTIDDLVYFLAHYAAGC
jgi:glucose/arabinose dehydrogenase